jgi:hypothetical protein
MPTPPRTPEPDKQSDDREPADRTEHERDEVVGMPEDVVIHDTEGRWLIVSPTAEGVVVRGFHPRPSDADVLRLAQEVGAARHRVRSALDMLNATPHVVAELDRDNARGLSDALAMAAAVNPER